MRPPYPYYGAKVRLSAHLVGLMPAHRVYLEPFFGSGAVFFAKAPGPVEILNDADDAVVTFLQVLRDRPEDLLAACALTPHARSEHERAQLETEEVLDEVERARRFWVRANQGFAKTTHTWTGWSVTTARNQALPSSFATRLARFRPCAERLLGASIECCDGADLVDRLATTDSVVYVDPPYLASTRNHRRAGHEGDYRHDMLDEASHRRLAEVLTTTPAKVLISGYDSDLYAQLYRDWQRTTYEVVSHSANSKSRTRSKRLEVVWTNYEPPTGAQLELFPTKDREAA